MSSSVSLCRASNFYPRPPRGGRHLQRGFDNQSVIFLSTPSARRATLDFGDAILAHARFLSTPSARRATYRSLRQNQLESRKFLSTPSARRATEGGEYSRAGEWISIHALREEGDISGAALGSPGRYFYPRPPRGGRRLTCAVLSVDGGISIHALREEGD